MRYHKNPYFMAILFSLFAIPACSARTDSVAWAPTRTTIIGDTQVQPGNYQLKADEEWNELDVLQGGKVIATVVCYWRVLPKKAETTEVKMNSDRVAEVQFRKRSESILF